jgi:phenylalanyl-tRNA synthetase beta chain
MKVSYNWLQEHFEKELPAPEKLVELLTFGAFEIEGVEDDGKDTVLDVKVLPDRAHYALSHKGIAYEISALTNIKQKDQDFSEVPSTNHKKAEVKNLAPEACLRYEARLIEGVTVKESPKWLKEKLQVIGQRSINNIVDATNYVMYDRGQPLHAFDADKVVGGITIRFANKGEKITTLDNKDLVLDESMLLIADDTGPLAIAGVKGGNRAGVTESTKNIILESANFSASLVRKTSTK